MESTLWLPLSRYVWPFYFHVFKFYLSCFDLLSVTCLSMSFIIVFVCTVFAEISAHPEINAHQKQWFFKGGSTQNRWALMGGFSKGGLHETDGWFFKGGSTQNRWVLEFVLLSIKMKRPGRLFWQIRYVCMFFDHFCFDLLSVICFADGFSRRCCEKCRNPWPPSNATKKSWTLWVWNWSIPPPSFFHFSTTKVRFLWGNFAENDNEEDQLQNIYVSIRKMPKSNHDLLERVFFHLAR